MSGESITHIRRALTGTNDSYGDATMTETGRTDYVASVWPRMSSETEEPGRTANVIGLTLALPRETVVTPQDQFIVRGGTYEVDATPADYRSPWTGFGGVVVNLTRVEG